MERLAGIIHTLSQLEESLETICSRGRKGKGLQRKAGK